MKDDADGDVDDRAETGSVVFVDMVDITDDVEVDLDVSFVNLSFLFFLFLLNI